jgi:hypothetical protein
VRDALRGTRAAKYLRAREIIKNIRRLLEISWASGLAPVTRPSFRREYVSQRARSFQRLASAEEQKAVKVRASSGCKLNFSTERSDVTIVFPPEEFMMKDMSVHNADCMDLWDGKCGCRSGRRPRRAGESPRVKGLRRRRRGARARLRPTRVNDSNRERLKAIELAIANYNAMIRTLKKQMQEGTANFRQALAQYQEWREDLDVQLGLERAY